MFEIRVVNIRHGQHGVVESETSTYIGRPSPLGNPYYLQAHANDAQRAKVVSQYADWLDGMLHQPSSDQARAFENLVERAKTGPLDLVCWCKPKACHGDVIADRIRARLAADAEKEVGDGA